MGKIEIYFAYNTFVSYVCSQRIFFQEYIKMKLKIFFVILKDFQIAKLNIAIVIFKQASITCR